MTASLLTTPLSVDTQMAGLLNLGPRFANVQVIGYGGSGLVLSANDTKTNRRVAIKRLALSEPLVAKRALREITLMRKLNHENVVKIQDILTCEGKALDICQVVSNTVDLKQVCIVQEILDTDLHRLIRAKLLTPVYAKLFLYQLLRGLKYIHSANVIHRDLKPSNILVNCEDLTVKISDFGLCRVIDPVYDHSGYLTARVGTCWYLSPEQILRPRDYSRAVDLWGAGCVFAEMLLGRPVFTGAHELNQMLLILDSIHLEEEDWGRVLRVMPNKLLKNHPFRPRTPLGERFTDIHPQALDLLEKMLTFDPVQRVTAQQALNHPYLAEYHGREPRAQRPLSVEYEVEPTTTRVVQRLIIEEANVAEPATCGSIYTPPVSPTNTNELDSGSEGGGSSPTGSCDDVRHETHTLDEILHIDEDSAQSNTGSSSVEFEFSGGSSSSSVEDLNMRNLRHSQDNLHHSASCQHILSVSHEQHLSDNHQCETHSDAQYQCERGVHENHASLECTCTKQTLHGSQTRRQSKVSEGKFKYSDDEKDVAEPSLQKIVEDKELEQRVDEEAPSSNPHLNVHIDTDVAENFKEYSQLSPKEENNSNKTICDTRRPISPRSSQGHDGVTLRSHNQNGARSKPDNQVTNHEFDDESAKERKLLEFESERYSKFEAEIQENEKSKKRRAVRNRNNQSSDPDEMYRLPTEHLRIDRDYSNERIRHKRLSKVTRHVVQRHLALYRDEINELNERLKEASIDGAVGGVDVTHDVTATSHETSSLITVSNISIADASSDNGAANAAASNVANRRYGPDVVNNSGGRGESRARNGDGQSSPEDNPSSPRASFSSGARPKKSPRKQKAL